MLKKGIALFMAICMMSTCVPMAFAEEPLAPALAESTSVAAESAAPQSVPTSTPAAPAESAPQSESASTPAAPAESAPQSESTSASAAPAESAPQSVPTSTPAAPAESAPQSVLSSSQSTPASSSPQSESVSASTSESTSSEPNGNVKTPMDGEAKSAVKPYETATYELTWTANSDGKTVTITGITGTASGKLVLPATIEGKKVTTIGGGAFDGCSGFTGELVIPNSVTTIDYSAFNGCSGFTGSLTMPNSVTYIGLTAFSNCSGFTGSLTLSNSLKLIDLGAFRGCSGFTGSLTIPDSVTYIGVSAFFNCSGFNGSLTIPDSVTYIGDSAFSHCTGLTGNLTISNSVTTIEVYTFSNCSNIMNAMIPPSVADIDAFVFFECPNLKFITGKAESYAQAWAEQNKLQFITDDFIGVALSKTELALALGSSETLATLVLPLSDNQTVTWTSSDAAVASVENGKVTALKVGKSIITATANGKTATCEVLVKAVPESGVAGFVERLYTEVLGRASDADGKANWILQLQSKANTGAQAAHGFVTSVEMKARGLSNEDFLKVMYRTFFNRDPDNGGFTAWMGNLNNGISREFVLCGFANSAEFTAVCNQFGIERGTITSTQPRDKSGNLTSFVNRLYTKLLDRQGEEDGLNAWTNQILSGAQTPQQVAHGFVFSKEFESKNLNNEKFVEYMYRTFMGREYDAGGKANWVKALNDGKGREYVFNGFANSVEFAKIVKSFGL